MKIRRRIIFSGRVQGVGFRFTAVRAAANYDVVGFVRNMANGNVEVEIEGSRKDIQDFTTEMEDRMRGNIREVKFQDMPVGGSYHRFEIRY